MAAHLQAGESFNIDQGVQVDSIQKIENRLQSLPSEYGGGHLVHDIIQEFRDGEWDDIVKVPGIRAVWSRSLSAHAWGKLGELSDLECLKYHFGRTTNEDLKCLATLIKLEVLVLCNDVYSSKPNENTFRGRELPYSAIALETLGRMNHLRALTLCSDGLLDGGLAQVKAVPHLQVLNLKGHFSNEGLKHLSELPEIRRLALSGHFDDEGLVHLAKLDTLETLALSSDRLTGRGLVHLAKLPKLRHLIIGGLKTVQTFDALKDFAALEVLNLGGDLTDELLATLPHSDRIKSLSLQGASKVTDEGLKHLLRLPQLEELNLLQTGMSPQGLKTISSLSELRKLVPDTVSTTSKKIEQGLAHLSKLPKLEALDLRYMGLEGVDVRVLDIPTLRKLNVDTDRAREEIKQLREQIPQLDPATTERVTIRAEIVADSSFWSYDFLSNQMDVDID